MKTNTAFGIFMFGLILTMGAVGGMETASDLELLQCLGIAVAGLSLMFVGTSAMNVSDYYDRTQNNPTLR